MQPNFTPKQTKIHGEITGGVWSKSIRGSTGILRRINAIAFDRAELDAAQAQGAVSVDVLDTETDTHYLAPLDTIREVGKPIEFGSYGRQLLLGFNGWAKMTRGQKIPEAVTGGVK